MKITTYKIALATLLVTTTIFNACKKMEPASAPSTNTPQTYSSLYAFYSQNQAPLQQYTINAGTGGSFTTPQGTVVKIPANVFVNANNIAVTGNVTIEFQDIYKKSDMLLTGIIPAAWNGAQPMNSGGEFLIYAKSGNNVVKLSGSSPITVTQPLNGWPQDKNMQPFVQGTMDSNGVFEGGTGNWTAGDTIGAFANTVAVNVASYVFSFYQFAFPIDSGTWCNSDDSAYFKGYTKTSFLIQTTDTTFAQYNTDVFLLFNGINSMVHVYSNYSEPQGKYPYSYAPLGLNCTVVAIGVDSKGNLNSAFVPNTTITANGTVNFTFSPTTTAAFKTQLALYNH